MNKVLLFILTLSPLMLSAQNLSDDILGIWLNESQEAKVAFYKEGSDYFGKIIWTKPSPENPGEIALDVNNPDPIARKKPLVNMVVLKELTFDDNQWINGNGYSPERGKYFKVKAWLDKKGQLNIRGYKGIFYDTEIWTRME